MSIYFFIFLFFSICPFIIFSFLSFSLFNCFSSIYPYLFLAKLPSLPHFNSISDPIRNMPSEEAIPYMALEVCSFSSHDIHYCCYDDGLSDLISLIVFNKITSCYIKIWDTLCIPFLFHYSSYSLCNQSTYFAFCWHYLFSSLLPRDHVTISSLKHQIRLLCHIVYSAL